jgi:hypothetical protein
MLKEAGSLVATMVSNKGLSCSVGDLGGVCVDRELQLQGPGSERVLDQNPQGSGTRGSAIVAQALMPS